MSHRAALITIAVGVVAFVAGVYGVITPEFSGPLAGLGLLALFAGTGCLIISARPWRLSAPNPYVVAIAVIAAALHAYEHLYKDAGEPSVGFLVWSMVPYCLALALAAFPATRRAVVVGAILALAFDIWGHYSVFVNPQGSTAALALLFFPLWSTIIVIPLATYITWLVKYRQTGQVNHAP